MQTYLINLIIIGILALISCNKGNNSPEPFIQYNFSGKQIKLSGGRDTTYINISTGFNYGCYVRNFGNDYYVITGTNDSNQVMLAVNTVATQHNLTAGTYTTGFVSASFVVNGTAYGINTDQDSIRVDITAYRDGVVDGTFSALVSDSSKTEKMVTQGRFQHLKTY